MRQLLRAPIRSLVRTLVSSGPGLRLINVVHRRLTPVARRRFFHLCCDGSAPRPLTRAGFAGAHATNFLAEVPPGRVIHSARQ